MRKNINWQKEIPAGFHASLLLICFTQAAVVLIFSGKLNPLLPFGLAGAFIGVALVNLIYGLTSRFPYSLATTHPSLGAISLLMIADISHSTTPEQFLPTALLALFIASITTGLVMLILGITGIIRFLRYMPYPVVAGFLAVTGWMLVDGSMRVMREGLPGENITQLALFKANWTGIVFGLALFITIKLFKNKYISSILILVTIFVINLFLFISGIDHQQAIQEGYFLSKMNISFMFANWDIQQSIKLIDWQTIAKELYYYAIIAIYGILGQTFRLSALETSSVSKNLLDKEITSCGLGVSIAGLAGGIFPLPPASISVILKKLRVKTVIPLLMATFSALIVLFLFPNILSYMPKAILIGLIISSGLDLLYDWFYQAFRRLPYEDFLIVFSIVITEIFMNFLVSIGLGIVFACTFFLVKFSRVNNIKFKLTGREIPSKRKYPIKIEEYLYEVGNKTLIMKLQGYLFFGSSRRLVEDIHDTLKQSKANTYTNLILDFQSVSDLDISSIMNFITLGNIAKKNRVKLILSNCNEIILNKFKQSSTKKWLKKNILFMPTLDYAQEWCEQQWLMAKTIEVKQDLNVLFKEPQNLKLFLGYLNKKEVLAGSYLYRQGESSNSLCFIESGQVTSFIEVQNEERIRLFTTDSRVLIGEMGFFSKKPRSTSVIADTDCIIYELTSSSLEKIEADHPDLKIELYEAVIQLLSNRIIDLNRDVALLQR